MIALGLELQRRGHDPVVATAPLHRGQHPGTGLRFHAIRPDLSPDDKDLLRAAMHERRGPEHIVRRVMLPAIRETFADLREAVRGAALLVGADLVYAAPLVAEVARIPWVAVTLAPLTFLSAHDPPVLPQAPWLAGLARVSPAAYGRVVTFGRWATRGWGEPVYRLRRELGLARGPEPLFGAREEAAALLGMFSPLVGEAQPDWPGNARVTGFAFYDRHEEMPGALQAFLDAGDPPVVFTLGSAAVFDPGTYYRESAAAARRLGRRAVLLVGPAPERQPATGDRLHVAAYAPFSELFPRAAAIVHQGGIGTTAQALRAGRPMLIVPFSHDQPDNAARMVRLGVARTIARRRYSAARAAAGLEALIADPGYAAHARQAAALLQREHGAEAAADEIERVLAAP
jgi:UDP:flavonoid glycosyltransferase YjiC (YdhE family)